MSVATAFKFAEPFPFCLSSVAAGNGVVSNLTLAEVMAFWWNLETFTITIAGTVQDPTAVLTYNLGQTLTAFAPAATAVEVAMDQGRYYEGSLFPAASSVVAFASLPQSPIDPLDRVCVDDAIFGLLFSRAAAAGTHYFEILFRIFSDFTNAGKYAVQYSIDALFTKTSGGRSATGYFQQPGGGSGGTLSNTGTITIGGISFPWEFYADTAAYPPPVNGTLSAVSTSFTYP